MTSPIVTVDREETILALLFIEHQRYLQRENFSTLGFSRHEETRIIHKRQKEKPAGHSQSHKTHILRFTLTSVAMTYYAVRSAPYSNRPWSIDDGKEADEGVAREHGSCSHKKTIDSLERSRRIKKRQEEWKTLLNSGKSKEDPQAEAAAAPLREISLSQLPMKDQRHSLVYGRHASSSNAKENCHLTKTAETLSLRNLRDRRRRGELVRAAKLAVNVEEEETKNLRELREQERLRRRREIDAKKQVETSHRLSELEREMSSPSPTTTESESLSPPAKVARNRRQTPTARKRRQKPMTRRQHKSIETDWLDSLLIKIFSVSCCADQEVEVDPIQ